MKLKRYTVDKKKFVRFIFITTILLCITIRLSLFMFQQPVEPTNNNYACEKIQKYPTSSIITQDVYASSSNVNEEYEIVTIDYSKKPDGLPNVYYDYVIKISEDEEIPKEVILAIMTIENRLYDATAENINSNGTVDKGLCQINSAYEDYYADTYNIENMDPYNAEHAIIFVARHMKYLSNYGKEYYNLSDYDSYIFAAGAYNRGLSNECKYRNMYEYKTKFINQYNNFI